MQLEIEAPTDKYEGKCEEIFASENEMKEALKRLCYGDLYVVGKLWINALKAVLVGAKICLIPVVHAANPPPPPQKPPPMKYTNLPLYTSPHMEYKDYIDSKEKCPSWNSRLLHELLCPYVGSWRKSIQTSIGGMADELILIKKEICSAMKEKKKEFIKYMRDPENLRVRQGTMALGAATGYYLGSGKGIPRRMFFTGLGTLAAGALCFPKETDESFRSVLYQTGKLGIAVYNLMCGKEFSLRERLPCKDDLPPPPPPRKGNVCPPKK